MIIKGKSRGRYRQLARHLAATDDNESVRVISTKGIVAGDIAGALAELEAQGLRGRSQRPLYHASISPAPRYRLSDTQIAFAAECLARKLGLENQPHILVLHQKHGREHFHIVWSRIGKDGLAIPDSWNFARHEEAARELEAAFGHERIEGSHGRFGAHRRHARAVKEYEIRQTERSGVRRQDVEMKLTRLWNESRSGGDFREAIERAGYQLVRGDQRGFVVLDQAGEAHSLSRRLRAVSASDMRAKLADLSTWSLPDIRTARRMNASGRVSGRNASSHGWGAGRDFSITTFRLRGGRQRYPIAFFPAPSPNRRISRMSIRRDFAARIAAACEIGSSDEIAARVRRLREEEQATLAALSIEQPLHPKSTRRGLFRRFRVAASEVGARKVRPRVFASRPSSRPK
jgi:Relaxase/Mobilisation nuclease domain